MQVAAQVAPPSTRWGSSSRGLATKAGGGLGDDSALKLNLNASNKKVAAGDAADPLFVVGDTPITEMSPADAGKFYELSGGAEREFVPEGCPAFLPEFEMTATRRLMIRGAFFRLLDLVAPDRGVGTFPPKAGPGQAFLEGPAGAGKSVLLGQMVHWARASGWLTLYIPNSRHYLSNSSFSVHEPSGLLDTADTACELLQALHLAHAKTLAGITLKDGTNLGALVDEGLLYTDAVGTVPPVMDIAVRVLEAMRDEDLGVPVLFAVDDFNSWLGGSEYFHAGDDHRKQYAAGDIRLLNLLRDMRKPVKNGTRVFATSSTIAVSPRVHTHCVPIEARRRVALLDYTEIAQYVAHLQHCECALEPATNTGELQLLSGGNVVMVRKLATAFSTMSEPSKDNTRY